MKMIKQKTVILIILAGVVISTSIFMIFTIETKTDIQKAPEANMVGSEKVISTFQKDHSFSKQSMAGTLIDDAQEFVKGKQSLKVTTSGDGKPVILINNNISPKIDFTDKFLKLWVKINERNKIDKLSISISGDNFESKKIYWIHKNHISPNALYFQNNQWNPLTISLTQTENIGSPDISKINSIEILVKDKNNGPVSVWFDELTLVDNNDVGVATFTFDDSIENQYRNARPILAKYNFSGTTYINTGNIGKINKLTLEQLVEMQNVYGWDISSHAVRHLDITQKRFEAELEDELALSKQYLLDNGLTKGAEHFAYPFGKFDNNFSMDLVKKYYKTARVVRGDVETLPVADPYKLRVMYVFNYTNPDQVSKRVQNVMENGDWLILVFHGIVDSDADNFHLTYLKSNFEKIVNNIYNKGIKVKTVSEVYNSRFP